MSIKVWFIFVPRKNTNIGTWASAVASPTIWNMFHWVLDQLKLLHNSTVILTYTLMNLLTNVAPWCIGTTVDYWTIVNWFNAILCFRCAFQLGFLGFSPNICYLIVIIIITIYYYCYYMFACHRCLYVYVVRYIITFSGSTEKAAGRRAAGRRAAGRRAVGFLVGRNAAGFPAGTNSAGLPVGRTSAGLPGGGRFPYVIIGFLDNASKVLINVKCVVACVVWWVWVRVRVRFCVSVCVCVCVRACVRLTHIHTPTGVSRLRLS